MKGARTFIRNIEKRLLDLDDDRYYQEIDHAYETYGPT